MNSTGTPAKIRLLLGSVFRGLMALVAGIALWKLIPQVPVLQKLALTTAIVLVWAYLLWAVVLHPLFVAGSQGALIEGSEEDLATRERALRKLGHYTTSLIVLGALLCAVGVASVVLVWIRL